MANDTPQETDSLAEAYAYLADHAQIFVDDWRRHEASGNSSDAFKPAAHWQQWAQEVIEESLTRAFRAAWRGAASAESGDSHSDA